MIGAMIVAATFTLTSPAFKEGGSIPSKYTCDAGRENPSPALEWKDPPAGTKSLVLIMHDPDAPMAGGFTHWVLYDIPPATTKLPEAFQPGSVGVSGKSDFGRPGYGGPCPPTGTHHYHFILSALDVPTLGLRAGATKAEVEKAMRGHLIGTTELVGVYQRKAK